VKIVKIYGGLGNQMFQYAFAMSLAGASGDVTFLDTSSRGVDEAHNGFELGRLFNIYLGEAPPEEADRLCVRPTTLFNRIRRKYFTKPTHRIDRIFCYQPELLELSGDVYYEGYWQSEKYFWGIEAEVRATYSFPPILDRPNEEALGSLRRPVASLHVRRGDYLKYPNLSICTPDYYSRAVAALRDAGDASSLLVFSDDLEYCRSELDLGGLPAVYVEWNQGAESWRDMAMMARCDAHVIANSSFSWWGAWLDPRPRKRVIAPKPWNRREIVDRDHYYAFRFGDIVPESWERVAI
jgi:hypothetical protein